MVGKPHRRLSLSFKKPLNNPWKTDFKIKSWDPSLYSWKRWHQLSVRLMGRIRMRAYPNLDLDPQHWMFKYIITILTLTKHLKKPQKYLPICGFTDKLAGSTIVAFRHKSGRSVTGKWENAVFEIQFSYQRFGREYTIFNTLTQQEESFLDFYAFHLS